MPEPFRSDDDLVSAVLDDEATADERARVAADPVLSARLAEFRAVATEVGGPVTPRATAARDAALATAVAERRRHDEVVVAMRPRPSTGSWLAAAAVLVVLLGAGLLLGRLGDDTGSEDSASSDTATFEEAGDGADTAAGEVVDDGGPSGGSTAFDEGPPVALGAVADETELRAALVASGGLDAFGAVPTTRTTLPAAAPPPGREGVEGGSEGCLIRLEESDPVLDGILLEGTATYAGSPAVVYVLATADGDTRVVVVTAQTCRTLVSFPL